ncbi:hypothetical protein HPB47_004098, partial [Ixodes persulcatus]
KVASLEEELVKHKEEIRKQQIEINASRALLKERNDQVHKLRSDLEYVSIKHRRLQEESRGFGIQKFQSSNVDVQFYTGLPSYAHFQELLKYVEPGNKGENIIYWKSTATSEEERRGRPQKISIEDQLFLVLVKL